MDKLLKTYYKRNVKEKRTGTMFEIYKTANLMFNNFKNAVAINKTLSLDPHAQSINDLNDTFKVMMQNKVDPNLDPFTSKTITSLNQLEKTSDLSEKTIKIKDKIFKYDSEAGVRIYKHTHKNTPDELIAVKRVTLHLSQLTKSSPGLAKALETKVMLEFHANSLVKHAKQSKHLLKMRTAFSAINNCYLLVMVFEVNGSRLGSTLFCIMTLKVSFRSLMDCA